jgi:hypothetical protein
MALCQTIWYDMSMERWTILLSRMGDQDVDRTEEMLDDIRNEYPEL